MTGGDFLLLLWMLGSCCCWSLIQAKERAILEVVLYEKSEHGGEIEKYEYKLGGRFSSVGTTGSAEGAIVQIHPMGLCNDGDFDDAMAAQKDFGWVVVVKLELPQLDPDPCMSIYNKAKRAIQRGATAVVFDVTDNHRAARELKQAQAPVLERPVVIVRGTQANHLMTIVNNFAKGTARARIKTTTLEHPVNQV